MEPDLPKRPQSVMLHKPPEVAQMQHLREFKLNKPERYLDTGLRKPDSLEDSASPSAAVDLQPKNLVRIAAAACA